MGFEVEFITLGDASGTLNVPPATLRHWSQQLEDLEVHYLHRNNRNERIYYSTDLDIFKYLRDMKSEFGRKTTTKDIAHLILEKANAGEFKVRRGEDAPTLKPSSNATDMLNQEDIQRLMKSDRVKQFVEAVIGERDRNLREEIMIEIRDSIREEVVQELKEELKDLSENINEKLEGMSVMIVNNLEEERKRIEERDSRTMEFLGKYKKNLDNNEEKIDEIKKIVKEETEKLREERINSINNKKKGFFSRFFS